jgi:hypothetical protein
MPKQSVSFGGLKFDSKTDALAFLREMLNRYRPGDEVSLVDSEVLKSALLRHPNASEKMGSGVAGFKIRSADYGTQCFWVMRTDGSTERFSYKSCV